jgi:hypothetical protein
MTRFDLRERLEILVNIRIFTSATVLATLAFSFSAHAEETDGRTELFAKLYLNLCMKNINNLEALRTQLTTNKLPKFPPEQAKHFLDGKEGDAWPVPYQGELGNFVVALPARKNFCEVYVRRANQADVERLFIKLVAKAPAPLISEIKRDALAETAANGKTHTISYTWSLPQATRKMLFTLTTASAENAQLQVLASAAMITD